MDLVKSRANKINLIVIAMVLAVMHLLALTTIQAATYAGENGKVAFVSNRGGTYDLFTMNADGSNQQLLLTDTGNIVNLAWSQDGTKIAYTSDESGDGEEIYVVNADGTNNTQLTDNVFDDTGPSWSPDGTKIAFASIRDGDWEIYTMNADGTNQTRLTNQASIDRDATWSPDGSKIAFETQRDGNFNIYTVDADGTNPTQVTSDAASDVDPSWSPDGTKIAFASIRDGDWEVFTMDPDGTNIAQITTDSDTNYEPSYTPEGDAIIFTTNRDGNSEIYTMGTNGSAQTNIMNAAGSSELVADMQPLNANPDLGSDSATLQEGETSVTINVLDNDEDAYGTVDPSSVSVTSQGSHGTAVSNGDGTITYSLNDAASTQSSSVFAALFNSLFPTASAQSSSDSFSYEACSSVSGNLCSSSTVTIDLSLTGVPNTGVKPVDNTAGYLFVVTGALLVAGTMTVNAAKKRQK